MENFGDNFGVNFGYNFGVNLSVKKYYFSLKNLAFQSHKIFALAFILFFLLPTDLFVINL